jgi:hypothetical protein
MLRRRPRPVISRARTALFGLVIAAGAAVLVVPLVPASEAVHEGDRAPRTLEAVKDAQYESDVLTEAVRSEAARKVEDVYFPPDSSLRDVQAQKLAGLFEDLSLVRQRNLSTEQRLAEASAIPGAAALGQAVLLTLLRLDQAAFDDFEQRAGRAVGDVMVRAVQPNTVTARVDEYLAQATNRLDPATSQTALRETLKAFVVSNVQVDAQATQRARDEARAREAPVVATYSRGQVIAGEGKQLDAADIEALRKTGVIDSGFDYYKAGGGFAVAAGLGLLLAVYLFHLQPIPAPAGRTLILVTAVILGAMAAARFTFPAFMPDAERHSFAFAVPVAAAAMVTAALAGLPFAALVAVAVAFFAAFAGAATPGIAGSSFVGSLESLQIAMSHAAAGLAGAVMLARAERLGRYAFAAVAVAVATGAALAAFWLIAEPRSNETLGWMALAAGVNGLGAAVVSVGVFVVLSMAFGITTRLQLMELAQGHPLLRRLQDEAPGTYHHSMMVGALAERAADGIGADPLVTRVGAYYHDVGKLAQPRFYIENLLDGARSPHEALAPDASAEIIRQHVTAGVELARQHRIPAVIRDFIPQHHGTRLVTYFYRRAAQSGQPVDAARFRYDGPRPQTKETAIVMLADSCEAVVRANQETAGSSIEELVDSVFAERLAEGQMDECDVTMRELQQVAASFKATLRAVYHPRIAYPNPAPEELARMAQE